MCGCASAHIAPTQESKFKPSNNETLLMLGLRKLAQQVGMCRHRASDGDTERMFHVPVPGTVQQQQPEHVSSRLSPDAPCRRACGARARAQGVQARGSARGRGRKARLYNPLNAGHAGPLPPAPPRPTAVRATRATREERSLYCHSTAPKRGSGSTRIRGRPTSSPAASSPQQRLSTETAALSPSTQYSPG